MFSLCFFYSLERLVHRLNKQGFYVQYSLFFRLFITKNGSEAYFRFKKGSFELQKRFFRTSKEPYLIMGRMLLKLRYDVAVTASGRSCCYVVT